MIVHDTSQVDGLLAQIHSTLNSCHESIIVHDTSQADGLLAQIHSTLNSCQ